MMDYLKSLIYEFLSNFVPKKTKYKVEGQCKKCGKCCKYMYSKDTYSENEFKIMQFLYPTYKRFKIIGKDEDGNLIFACNLVDENGLCTDYKKRIKMCRNYPAKTIYFNGKLHEGCGYTVKPEKTFKDYLE